MSLKSSTGGLTPEGSDFYNVKRPVSWNPSTLDDFKRKGSFLTRFYGQEPVPPLFNEKGHTRYSLQAQAWGEDAPTTILEVRELYQLGKQLLEIYDIFKNRLLPNDKLPKYVQHSFKRGLTKVISHEHYV